MKASRLAAALTLVAMSTTPSLGQDSAPVDISADSFVVDEATRRAVFSGNVVVSQTDLEVRADRVVVSYGERGPTDPQSFEATGSVRILSNGQESTGDQAVYDPKTRLLRLTGNVRLSNQQLAVTSGELVVDLDARTTQFSSGSGGRVSGVFTPQ